MRSTGNTKSNRNYNPNNKPPPSISLDGDDAGENIELERYIRDKYERKSFTKVKKPLPPSPTFQPDTTKVKAILGPPAARSPSLGSSTSSNLKPGQRASEESFERAKSPASTNSSVELAPPKPPRPGVFSTKSSNPFLQPNEMQGRNGVVHSSTSVSRATEAFAFPPPPGPVRVGRQAHPPNPFPQGQTFQEPQSSQPLPQVNPFTSTTSNPFLQPTS